MQIYAGQSVVAARVKCASARCNHETDFIILVLRFRLVQLEISPTAITIKKLAKFHEFLTKSLTISKSYKSCENSLIDPFTFLTRKIEMPFPI